MPSRVNFIFLYMLNLHPRENPSFKIISFSHYPTMSLISDQSPASDATICECSLLLLFNFFTFLYRLRVWLYIHYVVVGLKIGAVFSFENRTNKIDIFKWNNLANCGLISLWKLNLFLGKKIYFLHFQRCPPSNIDNS